MFNLAQTFYVDPSAFKGATEVGISRIDLFFRGKPPITNNASGIVAPGVEIKIAKTINGVPSNEATIDSARVEYGQIIASTDGKAPTSFFFKTPQFIKTDKEYAILIKYDGSEQFILWRAISGEQIVDTKQIFSTTDKSVGNLYEFISSLNPANSANPNSQPVNTGSLNTASNAEAQYGEENYTASNWSPLKDTDIKFKVYFARYYYNGIPAIKNAAYTSPASTTSSSRGQLNIQPVYDEKTNSFVVAAQVDKMEYISFEEKTSSFANIVFGETIYQDGPNYPGVGSSLNTGGANVTLTVSVSNTSDTVSTLVTANGSWRFANGITFNDNGGFKTLYSGLQDEYIVIKNNDQTAIRKVVEIVSNTVIRVDSALPFTNNAATFLKSPVAVIKYMSKSFVREKALNLLTLTKSNANASIRFVNNNIMALKITANGTGYSNSDYITVSGYEGLIGKVMGGYPATANIITNASGAVTQILMTNTGCGFVNSDDIIINVSNSSAQVSTGTGLQLEVVEGAVLRTESTTNNYFDGCTVENIETHRIQTLVEVNNPAGSVYDIKFNTLFYGKKDPLVYSGMSYYINDPANVTNTSIKITKGQTLNVTNTAIFPSRSNEFIIPYANGSFANSSVLGKDYSNSSVILFNLSSNNDFVSPSISADMITAYFEKYIINNDYTNEHTNNGNAFSKHITTKINFGEGRFAEDLLVYLTAYRPSNTDIKVYARVHNSDDPEAFDDKDWTLLEIIDGINVYSSKDNDSDYKEYTYNFPQQPNTDITLDGTAEIYKGQNYITGSGTSFGNNNSGVYSNFYSQTSVDSTTNIITLATQPFANDDQVTYSTETNKTPIAGLTNNDIYYVVNASATGIQLAASKDGAAIDITATTTNATFNSQSGVNDTTDFITISSNPFVNGDIVTYLVAAGNTVIGGLTNNTSYFVVNASASGVKLSLTAGGSAINITNNNISETGHTLYSGNGHTLYRTAVIENDLIRVYDPLFPDNYIIQVVNNVVNSTFLYTKRSVGDLSANLAGTIAVNTTATTFDGSGTSFTTELVAGDLIAVWSNSSVYEVRTISSITDANTLVVDSSFTFANNAAKYAVVSQSDYTSDSLNPNGLKIDRLAFRNQAFNYKPNENVVRYYNSGMVKFDTFNTYQLKIVLLSDNDMIIPKVDDIRAVGVSA